MSAPVLLVVFNRPDCVRRIMDALRLARPTRLYIAADGPRVHVQTDAVRCHEAREAAFQVDWPCEVRSVLHDTNRGCAFVAEAITWMLSHEESGIILEDDCLPAPDFFWFCEEMLIRYRADARIAMVSGGSPLSHLLDTDASYVFSRRVDTWGWATWRRAWDAYDPGIAGWPALRATRWLESIAPDDRNFVRYWRRTFDDVFGGKPDVWDYQWVFACWKASAFSIVPARNLVRNIGFGPEATHTHERSWLAEVPLEPLPVPLTHPSRILPDAVLDALLDRRVYDVASASPINRILDRLPGLRWRRRRWHRWYRG